MQHAVERDEQGRSESNYAMSATGIILNPSRVVKTFEDAVVPRPSTPSRMAGEIPELASTTAISKFDCLSQK